MIPSDLFVSCCMPKLKSKPSDWFKVNHVLKYHTSFFLSFCSVRQQYALAIESKTNQLPIVYDKKQIHIIQNKWNRTLAHTVVRQNP